MKAQSVDDMRKEFVQQGAVNVRVNLDGGITVYDHRKALEAHKWLLEQDGKERNADRKIARNSAKWAMIGGVFSIVAAILALLAILLGK